MALEMEKIVKMIIVVIVLVIVVAAMAVLWQKYIKPYFEDLGKAETAGIKTGMILPLILFTKPKLTKRYLNYSAIDRI